MNTIINSVITGTGSYIPKLRVKNEDFLSKEFFDSSGQRLEKTNQEVIEKFLEITTIAERRFAREDMLNSQMAFLAAEEAISASGIDKETLDYIIVAHNFGDLHHGDTRSDMVPSLAARVKHKLKIKNPETVAYDMIFGCPGWLESIIQANYFIRSGDAQKVLVIGAETLSRIFDPHDRDGMIYADGAGAVVLEAKKGSEKMGILAHKTRSDTLVYSQMLFMGDSYKKSPEGDSDRYLKMHGRKLYQYALEHVPQAIKSCLEKSNISIGEVKKLLIHQANGKMDDAILKRLYALYGIDSAPDDVMPMTIGWLGNSSVATIPTLLDLIVKGKMPGHEINPGDIVVFASVGAGMNINAMVYRA
ncbi:3-oxoacyl-ACP synthase III family protein [Robiginitalea aurantiaca]|uniref:Ketoacyl-ACP synthase III n=1 Tax=Robiginitalea aurantiaca TaxID=3056915 RepID=A0ABT7WCP5_9FLAO|nr:ketoacyl-ACP synthase III [Robiginitalea aurantiaca]MDM9630673.1 ketoacyl-ACP synthase III [Robiginitalea aurantiaca]